MNRQVGHTAGIAAPTDSGDRSVVRPLLIGCVNTPLREIKRPWEIAFTPKERPPWKTVFANLDVWSHRTEQSVKFHSDLATYRQHFDWSAHVHVHHGERV